MAKELTMSTVERTLTWAYKQALSSHGPIDGALELAESYQGRHDSPRRDANALIRWQMAKAAGSGFITGLPGLPAMPVTLPCEPDQCAVHSDSHDRGPSPLGEATTSTMIA